MRFDKPVTAMRYQRAAVGSKVPCQCSSGAVPQMSSDQIRVTVIVHEHQMFSAVPPKTLGARTTSGGSGEVGTQHSTFNPFLFPNGTYEVMQSIYGE